MMEMGNALCFHYASTVNNVILSKIQSEPSSWPSFCSRGSGDYGRHGSVNTALFKGAWEKSKGQNWGGKVGRLSASKNASSSWGMPSPS